MREGLVPRIIYMASEAHRRMIHHVKPVDVFECMQHLLSELLFKVGDSTGAHERRDEASATMAVLDAGVPLLEWFDLLWIHLSLW